MGSSQYDGNWGRGGFKPEEDRLRSTKTSIEPTTSTATSRRMLSLGEKRTPGTNSGSNENYLANHPISTLTQSSWRRERESLPAIDKASLLGRTGVLLPKSGAPGEMGHGLSTAYTFEAGQNKPQLKLKSTGGAGFTSSEPTEPQSASRRTPRRNLGTILNNMDNEPRKTPGGGAGGIVKPPLYVPTARKPSENGRTEGNYVAKTGFTSMATAEPEGQIGST